MSFPRLFSAVRNSVVGQPIDFARPTTRGSVTPVFRACLPRRRRTSIAAHAVRGSALPSDGSADARGSIAQHTRIGCLRRLEYHCGRLRPLSNRGRGA
jgi:hypothetical protein